MAYEVNIKGLEKLDEMIAKAERLGEALGGVKDQAEGIGNAAQSSASKASNSTTGIYSRRERYRAEHDDLISRGVSEGTQYNDAKVRMLKADKAVERWENSLKPKTEEDRLRDVLMTSRIGPDGKLYPIVGRMMAAGLMGNESLDTLKSSMMKGASSAIPGVGGQIARGLVAGAGSTAAAGAEGAAAASAAAAVAVAVPAALATFMVGAANSFSSTMRDRSNAYYTGGGGVKGTGQLVGLSYLTGESASSLAQNAVGFGDKLREGGYGASYMRQRGLSDRGIWQTDKATNYVQAIRFLLDDPNEGRAIRAARDLGLEDKLWMRDMDRARRERLLQGNEEAATPKARKSAANYNASIAELERNWAKVWNQVGDFSARAINRTISPDWLTIMTGNPLGGTILESLFGATSPVPGAVPGGRAPREQAKPRDRKALNDEFGPNVGREARKESIGGGERMRGAVPAGWRQIQMDEALQGQAANLGAFNA